MSKKAKVIIVGAGAREHALAGAVAAEGHDVVVAPGNAGTEGIARNAPVRVDDVPGLVALAVEERADLVVVGPELPLTLGLVDALAERGLRAFGPSKAAAQLEGSKAFMKRFCKRHGIPTAGFEVFDDADLAERHLRDHDEKSAARGSHGRAPLVVKADGLAAGKGVVVADDVEEACAAVDRWMRRGELGEAGRRVVLEERLGGEEASFHVVCDGTSAIALAPAQDHKRLGDGDRGPNTGGMGAYAPAPVVTPELAERVMREIVQPTLAAMAAEGAPFRGVLFVGLMIEGGVPRVLEYNVRFGDPEATVLVPTYGGDWFELLDAAARGDLASLPRPPRQPSRAALSVVLAAAGYPSRPRAGDPIEGLDVALPGGVFVLHAGTARRSDGAVVTAGGRVLAVGAHADTLDEAARLAYAAIGRIRWSGEQHRTDIGHRALAPQAPPRTSPERS